MQQSVPGLREGGAVAVDAGGVQRGEDPEDEEGDDLPDDTCNHHVVAGGGEAGVVVRGGGDPTARALEDERQDVGEDENPGVEARLEDAELRAEFDDDVFESQVDACGDEGRGDDQAADLDFEAVGGPGVVVEDDAADVAEGFGEGADGEGDQVRPGFVADAVEKVVDAAEGEDGGEEGVRAPGRACSRRW